jgi:hypothetical protein
MSSQRGLVQRIERKLEVSVGDAFARVFGGSIVPQEVEAMLRREAGEGIRPVAGNRLLAPNEYIITLGMNDYQKVAADPDLTSDAFAKHLAGYIGEQGWQTYGDVVVRFEQSANLHTGQFRTRGAVNPDVEPRPSAGALAPPQSDHAFNAEPGVLAMTDNSSYGGGQGQGRPGDDYYEDPYAPPRDDAHAAPDPHAAPPPRGGYPDQGGYGAPDPRGGYPDQGGYGAPDPRGGYPDQAGYGAPDPRGGYPDQAGYGAPDARGGYPEQRGGYPDQGGYDPRGGYPEQGGHGAPEPRGGYPEQAGYGAPDPRGGYPEQRGGYPDQGGGYPEQGGYGQGGGYGAPEPRGGYPEQGGGYDPGYGGAPGYGRQDYGQPADYGRQDYGQSYAAPSAGGYAEPGRDFDYGQPAAEPSGYGQSGYGQAGYSSAGSAVTLQLDDGSGRTYQLREGPNVIGRGQDAQFRLPDTGVSRRHLEIRWDGHVALLSDLNSTNGTTVNNAPVQEWQLADGDVVRLGHSEIVVHIH